MPTPLLTALEDFHVEHAPAGSGAVIVYAPNTYHFNLNLEIDMTRLFVPQQEAGIHFAELSEDIFGFVPVMQFHKDPDPVRRTIDRILEEADRACVCVASIGTGAELYSMWLMCGGVYDGPPERRERVFQTLYNYIDIHRACGVPLVDGHRPATVFPERHAATTLGEAAANGGFDIAGQDPDTPVSGTEGLNLDLAVQLARYGGAVSSTAELMYQLGMEPITIAQVDRFAKILQANAPGRVFVHIDTGHAVVGDDGKEDVDYNLMEYGRRITWPRWSYHFNALYRNEHRLPTRSNVEQDLAARGTVPHSDGYCNVYEHVAEVVADSRVVLLSPEPKETGDLARLAAEIGEVWEILCERFSATHDPHPAHPGLLLPRGTSTDFDAFYNAKPIGGNQW